MNSLRSFRVLFLAVPIFFGVGCEPTTVAPPIMESPQVEWREAGMGAAVRESAFGTRSPKGSLRLYRFAPGQFDWHFAHATSALSVREWAERFPEAVLVVNGVYFHEDNLPSGAFVTDGVKVGSRAFDADKSGIVALAPSVRLIDTATEDATIESYDEAAQTYPFLFKNGREAVTEDSGKIAERTFIGTDTDGYVYLGSITNDALSLYELMKLLADQPVKWQDVLNLDGGPSTGYAAHFEKENGSRNSLTPVPNVIVVEPR